AFGVELPLAALFDHPTVAELATAVDAAVPDELAPPIVPRPHSGPVPLSFAQQRLWFLDQLEPGSAEDNLPVPLRLGGGLDVPALGGALASIVGRQEGLRTRRGTIAGVAHQVVDPPSGFGLELADLSGEPDPLARAESLVAADGASPFDLAAGPLVR